METATEPLLLDCWWSCFFLLRDRPSVFKSE